VSPRAFSISLRDTPTQWGDEETPVNWGVRIVPQQQEWVIERFGKFSRVLEPGLHLLIPFVDVIAYVRSRKEISIPIPNQAAITMDNVAINVDGVLYVRVIDSVKASYGVENLRYAITQLAQTTMRSELGKISLDKTFAERESLNQSIVESINKAADAWGVQCLRYEIKDIAPPGSVKNAMDLQAEAERKKRATILESEGLRQSQINSAEGERQSQILRARGEAEAAVTRARATAQSISMVAVALLKSGGHEAVSLRVAEQYVKAWGQVAQKGTTILLPSNPQDPASMIASALGIYDTLRKKTAKAVEGEAEEEQESPDKVEETPADELPLKEIPIEPLNILDPSRPLK